MLRRFGQPPPPGALPPTEVRILDMHTEPWPDGRRFKVLITLTPFQQFPNLEVILLNGKAEELARTSIIETAEEKLVFTMHLRGEAAPGQEYLLRAILSYPDLPGVHHLETRFTL